MDAMATTRAASNEYRHFFEKVAPRLRVLHIDGRWNRAESRFMLQPKDFLAVRVLLTNFIPSATSLVSITIVETCPIPFTELITLCPSVYSIELVDPNTKFLDSSAHWMPPSGLMVNLHTIILLCSTRSLVDLTILDIVGQCINAACPGLPSEIRSLNLRGFQWFPKWYLIRFLNSLFSPGSSFDNLHHLILPEIVFLSLDPTSSSISLAQLPTLNTITFMVGPMTQLVSQNWPSFFTWLLKVLSEPHSLEKVIFEISLGAYTPVDDLMMTMDVLDGKAVSIPELTFLLILNGTGWQEEGRYRAFVKWLKQELPTVKDLGKLRIIRKWELSGT
ncbi:hypothetical protein DL96DRAFT_1278868 [Flagelloscypha sp. PMI_526]|nr:hypothetical protein DL96DRAFT_1278868 [Flagelloscypha sp. PMI_526]